MPPEIKLNEPLIAGPFHLFSNSFILEFLKPDPSRNASVLMRATFRHGHPLTGRGKGHPFCPPLHLHFEQLESFEVLQGKIGTTGGWDAKDRVMTPADGVHEVGTWIPHTFFPIPDAGEDSTILLWAHPDGTEERMDEMFFRSLILYLSDVSEGKTRLDPLQLMLTQHVTATALVWFPTASWLGPLRWWVPWVIQSAFAGVARWVGKSPILERYVEKEDWEALGCGKGGKVKGK